MGAGGGHGGPPWGSQSSLIPNRIVELQKSQLWVSRGPYRAPGLKKIHGVPRSLLPGCPVGPTKTRGPSNHQALKTSNLRVPRGPHRILWISKSPNSEVPYELHRAPDPGETHRPPKKPRLWAVSWNPQAHHHCREPCRPYRALTPGCPMHPTEPPREGTSPTQPH